MGMYDVIRCAYPLPVDGANGRTYQTQDTPSQSLDNYEIREDGSLWHQPTECSIEGGWEFVGDFTGEILFYCFQNGHEGWIEWSTYFCMGKLVAINLVENTDT